MDPDNASEFDPADDENQATSTFIYKSYGDVEMATTRSGEALAWYRQLNPELFAAPPEVTVGNVQQAVDSIREDPEFKALLDEIEADLAAQVAAFEARPLL